MFSQLEARLDQLFSIMTAFLCEEQLGEQLDTMPEGEAEPENSSIEVPWLYCDHKMFITLLLLL